MTAAGLYWLPALPTADAIQQLKRDTSPPEAILARIRALAQHRLDFVQTVQLDRVLSAALASTPASGLQRLKLAWLSSHTVEHLLPATRVAGLRRGLLVESYLAPYGQYRQELLRPASGLCRFEPDVVLLSSDIYEHLTELPIDIDADQANRIVGAQIEELRKLWFRSREAYRAVVIQQTVPNLVMPLFGDYDSHVPGTQSRLIRLLNERMLDAATEDNVLMLDLDRHSSWQGKDFWFDVALWHHAKQLISPAASPLYGDLVARLLAAVRGLSRKCAVVDLDGTLWGGVVGDDGWERLVLGQGSAAGEAFQAFQRYLKQLAGRGILLAVCSKNAEAIAEEAFANHPEMVLRREDIATFCVNWDDKASNLRRIANELNIGLDALVFIDDNPVERMWVRSQVPEVAVPEMPEDPALFGRCVADAGYFEAVAFTEEDRGRTRLYAENTKREKLRAAAPELDEFLRSLQMDMTVGYFDAPNLPRIVQLINKTNQFNLTTRRYTENQLAQILEQEDAVGLHFRLADCFGDNGLISVVILKLEERIPGPMVIDSWLMSCRVLGRGVEEEILACLVAEAVSHAATHLVGEYLPTSKNELVRELYQRLGFAAVHDSNLAEGGSRWMLTLNDYERPHSHINTHFVQTRRRLSSGPIGRF